MEGSLVTNEANGGESGNERSKKKLDLVTNEANRRESGNAANGGGVK